MLRGAVSMKVTLRRAKETVMQWRMETVTGRIGLHQTDGL